MRPIVMRILGQGITARGAAAPLARLPITRVQSSHASMGTGSGTSSAATLRILRRNAILQATPPKGTVRALVEKYNLGTK